MKITSRNKTLNLEKPAVMGILNVTPDSFSDGGLFNNPIKALTHARAMVAAGATIIDIGGESTRPGAQAVSVQEEIDRVVPAVELIAKDLDVFISIDTSQPQVIQESYQAGAHIWNDIRALSIDGAPKMAAKLDIPVILMHMQGQPRTMQQAPHYQNVVAEVMQFLQDKAQLAINAGVKKENIILDPGFGFGKSVKDNYELLNSLDKLCSLGYPVLSALSRKSMLGAVTLANKPQDRVVSSVAGHLISVIKGACMVRVHDVKETVEALQIYNAMKNFKDIN